MVFVSLYQLVRGSQHTCNVCKVKVTLKVWVITLR